MKLHLQYFAGSGRVAAIALSALLGIVSNGLAQGVQKKSMIQLADQYYAAGEFYTAANLYGQFLHPSKKQSNRSDFPVNVKGRRNAGSASTASRADVLYRQAESYRLANYWHQAAAVYQQCATDASTGTDALYWFAVCERTIGHYDSARQAIDAYLVNAPQDAKLRPAATKELETLGYIAQQLARPDSILVKVKKIEAPNAADRGLFAPAMSTGGQFFFSSTISDSATTAGSNPNHSRLFKAKMNNGELGDLEAVSIPGVQKDMNEGAATVSPDGKHLYFSRWQKEKGNIVSSIYVSTIQNNAWSTPALLASVNGSGFNAKQPFCSADGKFLYFASDRPGGSGGFDIWIAPLNTDGSTGEPVNAGTAINTPGDDVAPFYQASSQTLVFASNGRPGMGGYDLYASRNAGNTWNTPENLGYPFNSSRDDIYFFTYEKSPLLRNAIVSSDRGTGCCLESYNVIKAPKKQRLAGLVRACGGDSILANTQVVLQDAGGKTWKTTTNSDGTFSLELGNEENVSLTASLAKDNYLDTTESVLIRDRDEKDMLVDRLTATDLCMQKKPAPKLVEKVVIKAENIVTVYFDFDKSILKTEAGAKLDSIQKVLTDNPTATIQISGYTDGLGSDTYNKKLSDRRAKACADYLIAHGVDSARVSFLSFGACCPVEMEKINGRDNPDGRSRNRRALINITKEEQQ
jgi:outer membrane protein OmpA-like peptidoglycan-associated protein